VPSSCALLGGFAIGARVSLLRQYSAEREMSANTYTRLRLVGELVTFVSGVVILHVYSSVLSQEIGWKEPTPK